MKLLYVAKRNGIFSSLISNIFSESLKQASVGFARMMGNPGNAAKIFKALHPSGRLSIYGLVSIDGPMDPNSMDEAMELPSVDEDLLGSLDKPDMSDEEIVSIILGKQRQTDLTLIDFEHLGKPLEHTVKVIKNAVESGKKGINIILYGPPGSGKTDLSAVIAAALGLKIYAVGEDDDDALLSVSRSKDSTGKKRIAQLNRSHALLKGSKDSIVLFDEIEDLLIKGEDSMKAGDTESKIEINRLLEENPVVTIWTGNEPGKLIEAVRQRMTYSIYMDYPPTRVQEKIWRRRLEIDKCTLPDDNIRDLSRRYAVPPRLMSKAVQVLSLVGGGIETIEETLRASSKLSSGETDSILITDPVRAGFDLKYLNADCNLRETFNRLTQLVKAKKPFSLLIQDKPGLGSEDFLRLMAEEMSMNPQEYDVQDLMTPQPMMSPDAKIKMAFSGAVDGRQFLILKGLENMVSNPESSATKEWNDPLVKLLVKEALMHRLPLAVTMKEKVKLPDHLEIIFSDCIRMRPISQEQGVQLYESMAGEKMPEELVSCLEGVAPEDLLMLKDILAKSANDNIDHDRSAFILERLKKSRGSISNGPGFL